MLLERRLVNRDRVRRFVVKQETRGWDVREEEDANVIREAHVSDWHRVERALQLFNRTANALETDGWIEERGGVPPNMPATVTRSQNRSGVESPFTRVRRHE